MGYIFTHLYAGEEVLKRIGYETRSRKVFNFGTMGPDFLYAEGAETEKLFHNDKAEDFTSFLIKHSGEKTLDYAIGYATHIYVDMEMYPVLMEFAQGNFSEYIRLSITFDAMLAKRTYNVSIEKVNLASKINIGKNLPYEINALLKKAAETVYNKSDTDFNKSYQSFARFLAATYDPFLVKRMAYPFIKHILKFNIYELTYPIVFKNIPDSFYEKTNESLHKGMERSIKGLAQLIKAS